MSRLHSYPRTRRTEYPGPTAIHSQTPAPLFGPSALFLKTMPKLTRPNLLILMLAMATTPVTAGHQPKPLAAFVLFGNSDSGETVGMARVILDGADTPCPSLISDDGKGRAVPMTPRSNPDPKSFPIQVCEAIYPRSGEVRISGFSGKLPPIPAEVHQVTVFGDTGCKPSDQNGCHQDSAHHWPLHKMADAAAATDPAPDLILHMGDYNYRGTPGHIHVNGKKVRVYDAGDNTSSPSCELAGPYYGQNSKGSDTPDNWSNWNKDFFEPAAKLLAAAPWVFARGNHELCSRAGPGWFYLLDPGSNLLGGEQRQLSCPPAESHDALIFRKPYRIGLGGLAVVVLDSANACDQGDLHQHHFDAQFSEIQKLVGATPEKDVLWLQTHRPLWGVKKPEHESAKSANREPKEYAFINHTLQTAYARYPIPQSLHLVLSGHMHRFQAISFPPERQARRPSQLIVGNGGVDLARNFPKHLFHTEIAGMDAVGFGISEFGYMNIRLKGEGSWTGKLLDYNGHILATCDSDSWSTTGVCSLRGVHSDVEE